MNCSNTSLIFENFEAAFFSVHNDVNKFSYLDCVFGATYLFTVWADGLKGWYESNAFGLHSKQLDLSLPPLLLDTYCKRVRCIVVKSDPDTSDVLL